MCSRCGNPEQQHHKTVCYKCDHEYDDTVPGLEAHKSECLQNQVDDLKEQVRFLKSHLGIEEY